MDTTRIGVIRLGLFGGLLVIGAALAQSVPLGAVRDQQAALKVDLADGGIAGLTPRQNAQVEQAQAEVFALIGDKASWDALTIDEKVRVENALERINALMVGTQSADRARQRCWREKTLGSKLTKTRCASVEEYAQAREGARGFMERPYTCGTSSSGSGCGRLTGD